MEQKTKRHAGFWIELERSVASQVNAALMNGEIPLALLVTYLRDLEEMARTECDRRQTIQIVASARSLLGDRVNIGPKDGPFVHAVA